MLVGLFMRRWSRKSGEYVNFFCWKNKILIGTAVDVRRGLSEREKERESALTWKILAG